MITDWKQSMLTGLSGELVLSRTYAPIYFTPEETPDLVRISQVKDDDGYYSVCVSFRRETKITFGRVAAIADDFLTSTNPGLRGLLGVSSEHGYTIRLELPKGAVGLDSVADEGPPRCIPSSLVEVIKTARTRTTAFPK